ncbi:carbon-nitrogen hydrolase [Actinoplanes hulinensis]|uniref:Carbon-nitrogen hydrolase n=1 Tax=Actinoplanes hulinensis TaxID=1144547 RepID=A0ABS7B027_9ACTN|nr:nitrilase-related carbon-nitrogen hydrolase [Actinoplanes hulinensis]MBW6434345.1 carbon-nitrogen hydrolase [Actinoplanes hulinensis]
MPGSVRVAAAQIEAGQDVTENLAACLRVIDAAAEQRAQLVVLPEFCNHLSWYASRAQAHERATRPSGEFLTAIAERARRHGIWIKINLTHAHPDGTTGGTNFLFDPAGEVVGTCDKQTLMGAENDFLEPGATVGPVLETPLGRIGMYACMEGVINEVARGLALRGAQVLLNSLNSFALDEADLHIPVRAAENKVWVVAANKVGPLLPRDELPAIAERLGVPPEWLHGAGESQIVAPDGTVVAKAPRTGEAVVVADIDPTLADDKRRPDGTDIFATRRPELYGPIGEPPAGRRRPPGAPVLRSAVVRDPALLRDAVDKGAQLVVMPESAGDPAALAAALDGTGAHVVTTALEDGVPTGLLISSDGIVARQPRLHGRSGDVGRAGGIGAAGEIGTPSTTGASSTSESSGAGIVPIDLEWGRLAIIAGDDALYPETFRLAALLDTDVVAVPYDAQEDWELALGLPERAAENRLNLVVATPIDQPAAILAMTPDFTLWTRWEGPFTGRISTPVRTDIPAGEASGAAEVAPAQAANRLVSRNTDLVDGRPWRLVDALTR